jgi:creatinine amidohydrolase
LTPLPATRHDAATRQFKDFATLRSGYWQDLTTADFGRVDAETTVALLPVAAVEQHGPHLPLATDAIINEALVRATLERVPASAWTDIGRGVARTGLRKLVVLNTHGGQKALVDLLALRLRSELGMLVVRATYFAFGAPPGLFDPVEVVHDIHGGEVETSLLLHVRPELVRTAAIADFKGLPHELAARNKMLGAEKPVGIGWRAEDLHAAGACGNAARADGRRGAQHLSYLADRLAALLGEVATTPLTILR